MINLLFHLISIYNASLDKTIHKMTVNYMKDIYYLFIIYIIFNKRVKIEQDEHKTVFIYNNINKKKIIHNLCLILLQERMKIFSQVKKCINEEK